MADDGVQQIRDHYEMLGGAAGVLGPPSGDEAPTPDGAGVSREFERGSIYWSPATGAHEVHGAIHGKWSELGREGGILGYPLTDEMATPDAVGRFSHFERGSVYWTPLTAAHEVHGAIRTRWAELGWERGELGYPTTDETDLPDGTGRYNHFEHGSMAWTPAGGAHEVLGEPLFPPADTSGENRLDEHFAALGGTSGVLGPPVGPEQRTPDGGRFRHHQHGSIYWSPATGAHEVHGAIHGTWSRLGWEAGVLGYPTTDETATPDGVGRFNHFERGSVYWTPQTGAHEVHGAIGWLWAQLGYERGPLGYPVTDQEETEHRHSQYGVFQGGIVYADPLRGPYEVLGVPFQNPDHDHAWEVRDRPDFPPPDPASAGQWTVADIDAGISGLHAALLPTGARGAVWYLAYQDEEGHGHHDPQPAADGESRVLDLADTTVSTPDYLGPHGHLPNLFCGGHAFLGDGRLLMVGSDRGDDVRMRMLHTFTAGGPDGGTWRDVGAMAAGRWYPTAVTLPDGRVLMIAGAKMASDGFANTTFEVFDPATDTVGPATPAPALEAFEGAITYPFVFVLPDRRLLVHGGWRTAFLDLQTAGFDPAVLEMVLRPGRNSRTYGLEGTSVLLPLRPDASPPHRARVLAIGGGGADPVGVRTPATATCELLDLGEQSPAWRATAPLASARVMPDAVLLPDETVLVMSGSSRGFADNGANAVYETELFDPRTETWTSMAPTSVPRLYHATALLLPDGTVMTSGTDALWNPETVHESELRLEVFRPPYLSTGRERPVIDQAPRDMGYATTWTLRTPDAGAITSVALMRNGACTHSFNSDQRHIGLAIVGRSGAELTVATPPDGFVAPPGWYMLFLLRDGVPSEAEFVHVG